MLCSCEHGNELLDFIQSGEFINQMSGYHYLEKYSVPRNCLLIQGKGACVTPNLCLACAITTCFKIRFIRKKRKVHSCQQKSIGLKFSKSQTGSDVRYSCHHNSSLLLSPHLRIRAVSLSSIHYNQSHRVYINRRRQYICLI